ncbi:hypothetical protein [Streptomyces sp. NPDC050535]|uniref:hypothetical protein n=1 Tax=Streptomyces sp. NPDC050535 TaxID=3365626 RepID=UPI00378ECC3A
MVTVSLTGPSKEDAATVFGILRTAFPADHSRDALPQEPPGDHPVVWTEEFEPAQERVPTGTMRLGAPVTATLQGGYAAVDQLCDALGDAFAVQEKGTASGDQEKEVELRLGTRQ